MSLYDVASGNNGTCSPGVLCTAGAGWDGPTGLGTPHGSAAFTGANIVSVTNPGTQTSTAGSPLSLQVQASDTGSGATLSYSATGLPPGLVINSGTGLISGIPSTAGSYTVTATATDGTSASGSATFAWVVQALVTVPGPPSAVSATPGDAQAVVSWTAPVSNGGSPITGYTIAPSPACPACTGMTTTGVSSTVSGLVNGTAYTFTVTATNAAGTSPASLASGAVIPAGTLSGVVTAGGVPVANAWVGAYTLAGVGVNSVATGSSGAYTMVLPPGSYKLYVYQSVPVTGYPSQWVGGFDFSSAAVTVFTTSVTQDIQNS